MLDRALLKGSTKNIVRRICPLTFRKRLAVALNGINWIDAERRSYWAQELLCDYRSSQVDEYHRFLWSNHLGYAVSYEPDIRFTGDGLTQSRRIFFHDLIFLLSRLDANWQQSIGSVFEAGCSLGYQLRFMETDLFPWATEFHGTDIDGRAIAAGSARLRNLGSKVSLRHGGVEELDEMLNGKIYDVIICTGVLMYMGSDSARRAIASILRHSRVIVGLAGLAHAEIDNSGLTEPAMRASDQSYIHNFDSMIADAGGKVVGRRWHGSELVDGQSVYFVFATKAPAYSRSIDLPQVSGANQPSLSVKSKS
jgi:SAM-dependent methyltransferase